MPKPRTDRKTPLARCSSMRRTRASWLVTPTLKSPSVARMTRLMPPRTNCSRRRDTRARSPVRHWSTRQPRDSRSPRACASCDRRWSGRERDRSSRRRRRSPRDRAPSAYRRACAGRADQRQLVGRVHRARHVDQEDQIASGLVLDRDVAALQPDQRQLVLGIPWAFGQLGRDRERRVARRLRIRETEVVDQLFDPNRARRRQRSTLRKRRTLAYDAVSTSIEKVDSGSTATRRNGFSSMES